ncbi:MAG TPA: metallophosphoesterase [Thermoleophilia bacterium]|nr:metallophosphoesterase [Thermoleophilia bacterium]
MHARTVPSSRQATRLAAVLALLLLIALLAPGLARAGGAAPRDYVVGAVGDLCGDHPPLNSTQRNQFDDVAQLAGAQHLDRLLLLGDLCHNFGTLDEYTDFYAPTWASLNPIAAPVIGNHDYYRSATAAGFVTYFTSLATPPLGFAMPPLGFYSFDLGTWHVVVLNSHLVAGPYDNNASYNSRYYGPGTPEYEAQMTWLKADLAAHRGMHVIAAFHNPYTYDSWMKPVWDVLYQYHVTLALSGHDHNYQRWAPMNPDLVADPKGVREFVVGTGGYYLNRITWDGGASPNGVTSKPAPACFEWGQATDFGLLRLTLHATSYDYQFISISGKVLDAGKGVPAN